MSDTSFVLDFAEITLSDLARVGGKNASLGEMFRTLKPEGVGVLDGFATTAHAYRHLLTINGLGDRLRTIFVVPVAKFAYGFGGGFGAGKDSAHAERQGEGGGGGGGMRAFPAGALEITDKGTRFVPFMDVKWLVAAFTAGTVVGSVNGKRRRQ